jgi:hypothetical protein
MMWFPDLFERFSQFTSLYPGEAADVCEVSLRVANETTINMVDTAITVCSTIFIIINDFFCVNYN